MYHRQYVYCIIGLKTKISHQKKIHTFVPRNYVIYEKKTSRAVTRFTN